MLLNAFFRITSPGLSLPRYVVQVMKKINLYLISSCCLFIILALNICHAGDFPTQLKLGVKRIVIDPGFGGDDFGPLGCEKGVYSKNINLQIAKKLETKIRKELQMEVIMTRNTDKFLTLKERTSIANMNKADLFISIHTNASQDVSAFGIETYFLNLITDKDAIRIAAEENTTSTKNIADLQSIIMDLMESAKINEAEQLAKKVQNSICEILSNKYDNIKNRGAKQAPFFVLLGAQMPAILVDVGFITNKKECERLLTQKYQDDLVEGFLKGVQNYIDENTGS